MLRRLAFCIVLAGCAANPPPSGAPPLGVALSCNAEQVLVCPRFGCTETQPGAMQNAAVSLQIPSQGVFGRYCQAGQCEDAAFAPTFTRALGWTANVSTGREFSTRRGEVEVNSERSFFHLRHVTGGSLYTWRGVCAPAGS